MDPNCLHDTVLFDDALRLKYNSLVATLSEKAAKEQQARQLRALELLESSAQAESQTRRSHNNFCAEVAKHADA